MPRVKSIPYHQDKYILKRIQQLCPALIRIIYMFTNKKVKLIYNPKWDWYLKTIPLGIECNYLTEFYNKIKKIFESFNHAKMCIFYNKLSEKFPKLVKEMCESDEIEIWNLSIFKKKIACCITEFIELHMKNYYNHQKYILSSQYNDNIHIINFRIDQEKNNYTRIAEIEDVLFLCKSILFIHSKIQNFK
jgi:hypothetical protein